MAELKQIKKAAVIGAGVMGANIAAHLANAGIDVLLYDIVDPEIPDNRSVRAKNAITAMIKNKKVPSFMHKRNAKKVTACNLEDDLEKLGDVDWVIEAVVENPKIKSMTYKNIDKHRKKGSVVSSNTSTIPLEVLTKGQSAALKKDFMITHFFNPPRFMPLLEMVSSEKTDQKSYKAIEEFADKKMGKVVVHCKDTPGFIANRIGTFFIQAALNEAFESGIDIEVADAVLGKPVGFPKTGIFALIDMIGLDLMPHLSKSLLDTLPEKDGYRDIQKDYDLITKMIEDGYTGRKGKGGFYRLVNSADGSKTKEALNLTTGDYAAAKRPKDLDCMNAGKEGLRAVLETQDAGGRYAWNVLKQVFVYTAGLLPEMHEDIEAVDAAMREGYAWKKGPFEMMDELGVEWLAQKFEQEGLSVPPILKEAVKVGSFYKYEKGQAYALTLSGQYRALKLDDEKLSLTHMKRFNEPVISNDSASVWDIGDGVLCLEFHTANNAIDGGIFELVHQSIDLIEGNKNYKGLVLYNEGDNFSVGANLKKAGQALKTGDLEAVSTLVKSGQDVMRRLKFAKFPVIGAPAGMALGGGCEFLLHCDAIQAHAETYSGLVEVAVGIIPGWGGCKELIVRASALQKAGKIPGGPMPPVAKAFETISMAKVGSSAVECAENLLFRPTDGITMNKKRLLADAKKKALKLAVDYEAPEMQSVILPGASGKAALDLAVEGFYMQGMATHYDVVVSHYLAKVLTGDETSHLEEITEDELLELERQNFMKLVVNSKTHARMKHMMTKGKPLREGPLKEFKTATQIRDKAETSTRLAILKFKVASPILKLIAKFKG